MFAYVGCYTTPDRGGRGAGIAIYRMDEQTGDWTPVATVAGIANPSFLALAPDQRHLYCVHGGNDYSAVSAFARDQQTGHLTFRGTQPSGGPNPVHLDIEPTGRLLAVANYASGTVTALPLLPDGALGAPGAPLQQTGPPGPHQGEQDSSHPHHIPYDPAGRFLLVPDKGLDRVYVYRPDIAGGRLLPHDPPFVAAQAGAGPRHAAFHPTAPRTYVVNELDSTVTAYDYDPERGTLQPCQVISSLPPGFAGTNSGAEIAVAPSGRFLYTSNRGHDSIAIFAIDPADGTLTPLAWKATQGQMPRFFALAPSGLFLYAANQQSDSIVTFRVDLGSGLLTPTGQVIGTGSPSCIVFAAE